MDNTKISSVVAKKLLAEAGEKSAPERLARRSRHRAKIEAERQARAKIEAERQARAEIEAERQARAEILAGRKAASRRRKQADAARARAPRRRDPTGVKGPDRDLDTRDDDTTGY